MSMRLLDLDWGTILPWQIGDVSVEWGSFEDVAPFIAEHSIQLFGEPDPRFFTEAMTEAKRRFLGEMDVFLFRREGRLIGYWGGNPSDWSTYYCRIMAILPEFREGRLASEMSSNICKALAGTQVNRITVDTSIANVPMQRLLLGLDFVVTSTISSERWGTLLRFTRFLSDDAKKVFREQFVHVPAFGRTPEHLERRTP